MTEPTRAPHDATGRPERADPAGGRAGSSRPAGVVDALRTLLARVPLRRTEGGLTVLAIALVAAVPFVVAVRVAAGVADAVVEHDGITAFDLPVLEWFAAHRTPVVTAFAQAVSTVSDVVGATLITLVAMAALCAWRRSWTPALVTAAAMFGSLVATMLGKQAFGRLRPPVDLAVAPVETSPSFPSGHTLNAVVLAGVIAWLVARVAVRRWLRWVAVIVALAYAVSVTWSRLYLGAHWLTDVLTSWALGIAWLAVVIVAHQAALAWRRRRASRAR